MSCGGTEGFIILSNVISIRQADKSSPLGVFNAF